MKFSTNRHGVKLLLVSLLVLLADQVTKYLCDGASYSLWGDVVWIDYTTNTGASFGMFKGHGTLFIILAVIVGLIMLYLICTDGFSSSIFFKIALVIMMGGILGNLVDRLIFGYVRDFIYLKAIDFAVFNIADMAICIGTVMLVIFMLFVYKDEDDWIEEIKREEEERLNKNVVADRDGIEDAEKELHKVSRSIKRSQKREEKNVDKEIRMD